MSRTRALNSTAASLLGFLHQGPKTGWDLLQDAESIRGFWTLTQSQVYRELTTMEKAGLITAGATGPRDRKPYTLNDAGRAAFAEWIRRPPGADTIRVPFLLMLTFGDHLDRATLDDFIRRHRQQHEANLRDYEQWRAEVEDQDVSAFNLATLEFGIAYERAALGWFDGLPATLDMRGGSI